MHLLFVTLPNKSHIMNNPTKRGCVTRNWGPVSIYVSDLRRGLSRCRQCHANIYTAGEPKPQPHSLVLDFWTSGIVRFCL